MGVIKDSPSFISRETLVEEEGMPETYRHLSQGLGEIRMTQPVAKALERYYSIAA